jgi:co-chaperonin GroES (HSP10)
MNETFPRKPLLDRIIVREIPIAEYYEQPEGIEIDLDNAHIKERSDRGVVVAVSDKVDDVHFGDTVFFDEFVLCDPVFLNPAHKNRSDLPKYWQMRVADLKGVAVSECGHEWDDEAGSMTCTELKGHLGDHIAGSVRTFNYA